MNTCETDNWAEIRAACERVLTPELVAYLEEIRGRGHAQSQLIAILHRVQSHFGYLGRTQLHAVAQLAQIPHAKVCGVATFYHFFRLSPRGEHMIQVCLGTACYVNGAERVAQRFRDELGVGYGETTRDGLFSLEATRCLGTCGLAPVIMLDDEIRGPVSPDKVPALLERMLKRKRQEVV